MQLHNKLIIVLAVFAALVDQRAGQQLRHVEIHRGGRYYYSTKAGTFTEDVGEALRWFRLIDEWSAGSASLCVMGERSTAPLDEWLESWERRMEASLQT